MARTKIKKEIHHEPSTHDLLMSLESMPQWIDVLLLNTDKPFCPFIKWYSDQGFSKGISGKLTMKQISIEFGKANGGKITKWVKDAYNEILELHLHNDELFKEPAGIKQNYYIQHYSDVANLTLWLPVVPRIYEVIHIPFLKAKFGLDHFWIDLVDYDITRDGLDITIWLKGGFPNRYKDMLYYKAVFQDRLPFMSKYHMFDFEINETLLKLSRR